MVFNININLLECLKFLKRKKTFHASFLGKNKVPYTSDVIIGDQDHFAQIQVHFWVKNLTNENWSLAKIELVTQNLTISPDSLPLVMSREKIYDRRNTILPMSESDICLQGFINGHISKYVKNDKITLIFIISDVSGYKQKIKVGLPVRKMATATIHEN